MTVNVSVDKLTEYANACKSAYESELKKLVDIPSVSMDPSRKEDMHRAAEMAMQLLKHAGAQVEIIKTAGNPVVLAEFKSDPAHPTVAIYNHLDVQPADAEEWQSPPLSCP
jgi:acetylornithine deacetylase/succinyl-diaminopimelate desuccinylase-like protein